MVKFTKSYQPSGQSQSKAKMDLLHFAFGQTDCVDSGFVRVVDFLAVALLATLLFVLLSIKPVDDLFATILPNYSGRLVFKTLIFFLLILLLDRLITNWRDDINVCK